jgi:hypothetical protein
MTAKTTAAIDFRGTPLFDGWTEPVRQAKTNAQRQAARKARELAAGRVQWKRWIHPDDAQALAELADRLQRKRAKTTRTI